MPKRMGTWKIPDSQSPWQRHRNKWAECRKCILCETRRSVVLVRGTLPCDVLFVGEAPGESEDVLGQPFVGPAGHLLDRIVEQALFRIEPGDGEEIISNLRCALTNLVCCIPKDDAGSKADEPHKQEILACRPRLEELIRLANPKLIVAVGALAARWLPPTVYNSTSSPVRRKGLPRMVQIMHPAAILRMDVSQRGLAVQRCIVTIADAVEDLR